MNNRPIYKILGQNLSFVALSCFTFLDLANFANAQEAKPADTISIELKNGNRRFCYGLVEGVNLVNGNPQTIMRDLKGYLYPETDTKKDYIYDQPDSDGSIRVTPAKSLIMETLKKPDPMSPGEIKLRASTTVLISDESNNIGTFFTINPSPDSNGNGNITITSCPTGEMSNKDYDLQFSLKDLDTGKIFSSTAFIPMNFTSGRVEEQELPIEVNLDQLQTNITHAGIAFLVWRADENATGKRIFEVNQE